MRRSLGIVVPTLNEVDHLPLLLSDLDRLPFPTRILVADGGSTDGTVELAREAGVRTVRAPRGRASQMNVGAASLSTPWLLFLHADCRLPAQTGAALRRWLADPPPEEAAHFDFRLDADGPWWRLIEGGQRIRERVTGMAYGDQGLLLSRRRWSAIGGIPELPIMEDVETVRRLRRSGGLQRIGAPLITSARRYREEGPFRGWLRNAALVTLYHLGVSPDRLSRWYPPRNGTAAREEVGPSGGSSTPVVLVFAKAPRPGRVKTRLAGELGHERAAAIYRRMGRHIVDELRDGPFRIFVYHAPADAEAEMRRWLGSEGLEFRPQGEGDLGRRMARAFDEAFREAERVCIVGTDIPGLTRQRVSRALALLDAPPGCDAVFGPARDGGYYLLALRRPLPQLFQEIPWSTSHVMEESLTRAREAGLSVLTLDVLSDVDRPEDVPPALLTATD